MKPKTIKRALVFNRFAKWNYPKIHEDGSTDYGWKVLRKENLVLGEFSDLAFGVFINAKNRVTIGKYVQIGPYCSLLSCSSIPARVMDGEIKVGEGVLIGAYSLIMPGVTLGDGCIIPAYSYVDRDVPPMTVFDRTRNGTQEGARKVIYED